MIPSTTARSAILGVPLDPNKLPSGSGVVRAFEQMDARIIANSAGAIIKNSLSNLNAAVSPAAGALAWVIGDATVANNGVYENTGTSGSPTWVRRGDLPYGYIYTINVGAGTANAIQVTSAIPIPAADGAAEIFVEAVTDNTSSTVTLSVNGETALPVKTQSGGNPAVGGVTGFMKVIKLNSQYRMVSDQASAAIQAACEAQATIATTKAAEAAASAAGLSIPSVTGGDAGKQLYVKVDETGYELRAPGSSASTIDPISYGATYDGTTDDRTALANADTAAVSAGKSLSITGPMAIASDITVVSNMEFAQGGMLVPASDKIVTLNPGRPIAGPYQIFDRSNGGAIQFLPGAGEVWAEWWGAKAVASKTDNQIAIQHAVDVCGSFVTTGDMGVAPNGDGNGGIVRFASSGDYLMSGKVHVRNRTILRGNGRYTRFKANSGTWGADTEMFKFENGSSSQFWCRIEDATVDGNSVTALTRLLYTPSWQESCGLRDVLLDNYYRRGIYMDSFNGGSVGITLKQVQFFPSAAANNPSTGLEIDSPFAGSYPRILLEDITFAGYETLAPPAAGYLAIVATGRMKIQCRGVFIESFDTGISLNEEAHLYGDVTCGGNPTTDELITTAGTWTGNIDINVQRGGTSKLLRNYRASTSQVFRDAQPYDDRVVYPIRAGHVLASDYITDGSPPSLRSAANGLANASKPGTGLYQINFDSGKFAPTATAEFTPKIAIPANTGARTWVVNASTTTYIQIQFYDSAGSAADVTAFTIELVGRDGY